MNHVMHLPNIMKAKKKPIDQIVAKDLEILQIEFSINGRGTTKRKAGIKAANVAELVSKLKNGLR